MLNGPPGLACFDFDNTLIRGDLGESCMYYILTQGMLGADLPEFWEQAHHPLIESEIKGWKQLWLEYSAQENSTSYELLVKGLVDAYEKIAKADGLEAAYRWTKILFCGMSEAELVSIAKHVFVENQEPGTILHLPGGTTIDNSIRIRKPLFELVSLMIEKSWDVRIITASPECTIRDAATRYGLKATSVRGMRLTERNGILMPEIIEPMTFDQGKVAAIREFTSEEIGFAAGDSFTDLSMLREAKHRLLIDRGNEKLRAVAEAEHFWIQTAETLDV
ncbi:MAG: haloacid dehalogenase-like hydrolase [Leptospirales bacterium]|nr:haloacid dehalogenase-like hydrolase [Leptospirales bacterium]